MNPLIVIYGANNVGKSYYSLPLAKELGAYYLKYPVYDLLPTGPKINKILRSRVKTSDLVLQKLFAQNRKDHKSALSTLLSQRPVVCEDYVGTSIAWALYAGIEVEKILELNEGLIKPSVSILLDGPRRREGIEPTHKNEMIDDQKWEEARMIFLRMAERFKWRVVDVSGSYDETLKKMVDIAKTALDSA